MTRCHIGSKSKKCARKRIKEIIEDCVRGRKRTNYVAQNIWVAMSTGVFVVMTMAMATTCNVKVLTLFVGVSVIAKMEERNSSAPICGSG